MNRAKRNIWRKCATLATTARRGSCSSPKIESGKTNGFLEASIRPFVEDCRTDRVGCLVGWYVEPEYRQPGVGRILVQKAERWARRRDCEEMASDAEIGNDLSFTAHLKLVYEESSRLIHLRKDLI